MRCICLDYYLYLNLFNTQTLTKLFTHFGGLESNTFSIVTVVFSDGSFTLNFNYPTDFTPAKASKLAVKVAESVSELSISSIQTILT